MKKEAIRLALAGLAILAAATLSACGSHPPNPPPSPAHPAQPAQAGPAATPFRLTYNDNGLVVRVQEQYVP